MDFIQAMKLAKTGKTVVSDKNKQTPIRYDGRNWHGWEQKGQYLRISMSEILCSWHETNASVVEEE